MALEKLTNCPICNSDKSKLHLTVKDYTVSQQEFDIVACEKCAFLFTNPRPTPETLGSFYASENYISHTNKSNNLVNLVYKLARTQTLKWKFKLVNNNKPKTLLDYGCGTAHFLNYALRKDLEVTGFEPDKNARKIAKEFLGDRIYSSTSNISQQYDTITLWHVLEHVQELNEVMDWLKKHLSKTGKLIIAVPNPQSYDAAYFKKYWAAYDVPRHLYHFTKNTLTKLANKHSFCVESIQPMKLDSFYVSLLSNRYKFNGFKPIKSFLNGYKSNTYAIKEMNYSSLIYILKHNNV